MITSKVYPYICLMEVTGKLVENLAHLSRLEFSDKDREEIKSDLEKMISFIDKLNELDTSHVKPLLYMGENANIFREDEVQASFSLEEVLLNAPQKTGKYFKVPKLVINPLPQNKI
ncbi:MAG TPA: Asp-tRNA(Asn)/Glu-tRNA(Gln) amidotransferase subunit GatC [Chitinophagaceae bacterium]|nr:Asp-tRNA(Asn)/Glu-tRNA(Gln) amidotransferase subunit GatC [Chitinophagaceae bacterium]